MLLAKPQLQIKILKKSIYIPNPHLFLSIPILREEVRPIKSEITIYNFQNFNLYKVHKFMVQNTPKSNILSKNHTLLLMLKVTKNRYIFNNSNQRFQELLNRLKTQLKKLTA
jgi:hypothetical protein